MDLFFPRASFTVHIPNTGPTGHLFVIITDTCDAGQNLIVPVCSIKSYRTHDATCTLHVGDHPFVKHPSYIAYELMTRHSSPELIDKVRTGVMTYKGVLRSEIFARVCAGVEISDDAEPIYQAYYRQQLALMRQR